MIIERPYSLNLWYRDSPNKMFHKILIVAGSGIHTRCGRSINPSNALASCELKPCRVDRCSVCEVIAQKEPPPRILPCPWCHKDMRVNISGSYTSGWTSFVECCDYNCGARGPQKKTTGRSNDEYVVENQAIKAWNEVVKK